MNCYMNKCGSCVLEAENDCKFLKFFKFIFHQNRLSQGLSNIVGPHCYDLTQQAAKHPHGGLLSPACSGMGEKKVKK